MSTLNIRKGTDLTTVKVPIKDGQLLFETNTGKIYLDHNTTRLQMGGQDTIAWGNITSKPSYYDAKAIKSINRNGTTFTATHLDGTTSTFTQQDNNTTYSAGTGLSLSNTTFSVTSAPSISTMFSPDYPSNNTTGYRLIGTKTSGSWWNGRDVWVVSSRHTGVGILCFAWGHNAADATLANAYGSITYFGPQSGNGAVFYKDMFQIYYNESNSTFYLFWKYTDYNSTSISRLATNNGWNLANGDFMTSISTSTYGSLICQTTPCWLQGDAVTGAVWN